MTAWPGVVVEETNCPVGDGKEGGGKGEDNVGHKVANPQRSPGGWKCFYNKRNLDPRGQHQSLTLDED